MNERKMLFNVCLDLLNRGLDPNHTSNHSNTLLHTAVDYDNIEVIRELLKLGLKPETVNEHGENSFHLVKSFEVFKALMEETKNLEVINAKDCFGRNPFSRFVELFTSRASDRGCQWGLLARAPKF
jgi:ankyrin repeat protein